MAAKRLLNLGPGMVLPPEAVTSTFGLLAMTGAGKSNGGVVMAEEMYAAGLPWYWIDPKGDAWGIRAAGTGPGLPVPILGGLHGDVPLSPDSGKLIAELIVTENLTCVLDVSEFDSKTQQVRFLTDFAERLFRLHGKDREPRMGFLDEADEYLPQRVMANMARCVGAWTKMIKQGRQRGLGMTLMSQRSAVVNKDGLTQVATLFPMRTTGPQDLDAILAWVIRHALGKDLVGQLSGLDDGEAFAFSPHFLARLGQPAIQRFRFRLAATFDSRATPKIGQSRRPATLADINLDMVAAQLKAAAGSLAGNDPAALRRRVTELERQLAARSRDTAAGEQAAARIAGLERELAEALNRPAERVAVPVVPPGDVAAFDQAVTAMRETADRIELALHTATRSAPVRALAPAPARAPAHTPAPAPAPPLPSLPADPDGAPGSLTKAERAILTVLVQFPDGRTKNQIAILSGYSVKSSTFANAMSALRVAGLITRGMPARATQEGVTALGAAWEPLPSGSALISYWMARLARSERLILQSLLDAWPGTLDKAAIAGATGYSAASSTFANALSRLRTLELISGYGEMRADETLAGHASDIAATARRT
jgi:uncharacterized protein